jgi:lauroyl/myristoyl acyltransferase
VNLASKPAPKRRWLEAKYSAEYILLRAIVALLHILPLEFGSWLMGSMWRLIAPHLRRHEVAARHLAASHPRKSAHEIDLMARAMWMQLGRTFAESSWLSASSRPDESRTQAVR